MSRDYKVFLEDILRAIAKVRRYTAGMSFEAFSADEKTADAVVRNLEVIGEATKKIPGEARAAHPAVDWRKVTGLRDVLAHEYFGVDLAIVWDIARNKLAELEREVETMLRE